MDILRLTNITVIQDHILTNCYEQLKLIGFYKIFECWNSLHGFGGSCEDIA